VLTDQNITVFGKKLQQDAFLQVTSVYMFIFQNYLAPDEFFFLPPKHKHTQRGNGIRKFHAYPKCDIGTEQHQKEEYSQVHQQVTELLKSLYLINKKL
jgi:hypothetical protein